MFFWKVEVGDHNNVRRFVYCFVQCFRQIAFCLKIIDIQSKGLAMSINEFGHVFPCIIHTTLLRVEIAKLINAMGILVTKRLLVIIIYHL
jgi:hypothetical protein